jgi:hypothetical protein
MAIRELLIVIVVLVVVVWPWTKILAKAGYSRWWALLVFVPLANIIGLWVFALANWPAIKDRDVAAKAS